MMAERRMELFDASNINKDSLMERFRWRYSWVVVASENVRLQSRQ